jgi:AbrB family looped-hinge helix DNA binding protein
MKLLRVQAIRTRTGTVYYIHIPKEWAEKVRLEKGDYVIWEVDGKNRLILRKLR